MMKPKALVSYVIMSLKNMIGGIFHFIILFFLFGIICSISLDKWSVNSSGIVSISAILLFHCYLCYISKISFPFIYKKDNLLSYWLCIIGYSNLVANFYTNNVVPNPNYHIYFMSFFLIMTSVFIGIKRKYVK